MTLNNKTILLFTGPLYEDLELWYPRIRLEEEGAVVTVAGLDRELCRGKHGYPCKPDATADEVDGDDFDALVIPGGFAPDKLRRSARVLASPAAPVATGSLHPRTSPARRLSGRHHRW